MDDIHKRLAHARSMAGITQDDVAQYFRIKRPSVAQWEGGRSKPSISKISKLADLYGTTSDWLTDGKGQAPTKRTEPLDLSDILPTPAIPLPLLVPLLSTVSAGAMSLDEVQDEKIGDITVTELPPGDWIALKVDGDSMDRISPPESVILVNRRDKALVNNGCYIVANQYGEATYKRYRPGPPARFEPVSTNPSHEPIYPDNDVPVIGRVRRSIIDM